MKKIICTQYAPDIWGMPDCIREAKFMYVGCGEPGSPVCGICIDWLPPIHGNFRDITDEDRQRINKK